MALYLGKDKVKVNLDGLAYIVNTFSVLSTLEEFVLSSSDDCILKDFNGFYLLMKEAD